MSKQVLFVSLHDGCVFLDKTDSPFYRGRRYECKIGGRIYPSGLYSFDGKIKSIELTELLIPVLKFGSYYPIKFELDEGVRERYIYNFDHFNYREPTTGCNNGMYTLYFKRTQPKPVTYVEGTKWINEVINKSISIMENDQISGMAIKSMYHSSLEYVKKDLRKMGVDIWYDAIKPEPLITAEELSKSVLPDSISDIIKESYDKMMMDALRRSYTGGFTVIKIDKNELDKNKEVKETKIVMDYIDHFWKHHSIKIYNDRLELDDDRVKEAEKIIRIQDPKSKEIIEKNRDLFILFLKDMEDQYGRALQLIFIPSERKTILKSDTKQSVIVDREGKGKFDYLLAKELIFCKYRNNGHYDWYDKLTQHRKIKEV